MGIFTRCRPNTKDLAWNLVVYLSTVFQDLTKREIETHFKRTISYSVLNKLVEKEIITKIDWSWKKMLIDGFSDKPAYWKLSIDEMKSISYKNLVSHASQNPEIKEIIEKVFAENWMTNINPVSIFFIKIYNTIIALIISQELYDKKYGYWRLEWRPQSANKYKLNVEYLEMFEQQQILSLQKAMESIKQTK